MEPENPPQAFNPYQPNDAENVSGVPTGNFSTSVKELSRWQYFFAVLLIIGLVLMIGIFVVSMLIESNNDVTAAISGMVCMGSFGLILYGLPALLLWRAATSAKELANGNTQIQLENFASTQVKFWRVLGIIALIVMAFYAIAVVVVVAGFTFLDV
ncbi:hypothetical protein CA13_52330 [Planctomycetes bacterium CA13]|uniref:DUF5362 domain-containing protein n=1 Tax=Novipirellula herctigrandis TaxID=2527986 RepID=A0A5C5Z8X2_9BACT|nr:hypothetical protein CA13_52330 [Planctomycetes bacterium CA13]